MTNNSNISMVDNLERMAHETRILVSMPYIRGITPKVLAEKGQRDAVSAARIERIHGVFKTDEIGLPAFDHGLLYGDGAFEGVLVEHGRLFKWREHLDRLYASASSLQITIPYLPADLTQLVLKTVNSVPTAAQTTGYVRLVVTRGVGDLGIDPAKCVGSTIYCIASRIQLYQKALYEKGISLALARRTRRPNVEVLDAQIKSCNYLNNILALLEVPDSTRQEALMLTQDGTVAEATTDNIFVVVRNSGWEADPSRVTVSSPVDSCLKGISRGLVLGYARMLGYQVDDAAVLLPNDLAGDNREVFLTGTAAGIMPVAVFDGRLLGDGTPGPITGKFRQFLDLDIVAVETGLSVNARPEEIVRYLKPNVAEARGSTAISRDFIRDMFDTIDKRDWDGLQHIFCEDVRYERPGYEPLVGYERVQHFYRKDRVIAMGHHLLEGIIVNEDHGACWGRFVGQHKNGSPIDERFADAYAFQNGKIKNRRSYFFRPAV